jgi:hypothetical protein
MFYGIYLYTLCYYICCLLGACMRCTRLCPLKPGVTVAPRNRLAHRTLSGAHRTVRCTMPTIGAATCRSLIARTIVGASAVGSPDSPVHHRIVR